MHNFMKKATALVASYNEKLAQNGIRAELSRRYFETKVEEYSPTNPSLIDYAICRRARKREKKNGYNFRDNSFYCIVLGLSPLEKGIVPREYIREYSFILRSTERLYIGDAPKENSRAHDKILAKIEKRLRKILKRSQCEPPERVCRDTVWDALRYMGRNYTYKSKVLGRLRAEVEIIFTVLFTVLVFAAFLAVHFFINTI